MKITAALGVVALLCLASFQMVAAKNYFVEETFDNLKDSLSDKIVVFYRSKESDSTRVLGILNKAARQLTKKLPSLGFFKCDGDLPVNSQMFQHAQFYSGLWVFTATQELGIERYTHDIDADLIVRHVMSKFGPVDPKSVTEFEDEDSFYERMDLAASPKPIFVKFYEDTCPHCQKFKATFQRCASYFKDRVEFMDVQCSRNEETTAFCSKSNVRAYPTLVLFTGEDKIVFEEADRSLIAMERFFDKHVGKVAAPSEPAAAASATPKAEKESSGKPKGTFSKPSVASSPSVTVTAPTPAPATSSKPVEETKPAPAPAAPAPAPATSAASAETNNRMEARMEALESKLDQLSNLMMRMLSEGAGLAPSRKAQKDEL